MLWTKVQIFATILTAMAVEATTQDETSIPEAKRERKGRHVPETNIIWPKIAYDEHCASYTNRLSELVFGSLLASYILGFFGFGMNLAGTLAPWKSYVDLWGSLKLFHLLEYLIISATFSYLTAAYYVKYHNSILTMPQLPPEKLSADFGIALMQAILFGLSMIQTDGFLLFVGISLARVFWRQWDVFRQLTEMFQRHEEEEGRDHQINHKHEEKIFMEMLHAINSEKRYCSSLEGWLPVGFVMKLGAGLLIVVGAFSESRHFLSWGKTQSYETQINFARIQVVIYFGLFCWIWYSTKYVFEKGASHRKDEVSQKFYAIDSAAEELVRRLRGKKATSTSQ